MKPMSEVREVENKPRVASGRLRIVRRPPVDASDLPSRQNTALEALYTRYHTPVYSLVMFMLKQPTLVSMNTPRLVTYSPTSQFTR